MEVRTVVAGLLALTALAGASQRVMVIEDVTATWCTYCPGAARGADELKFRAFDSVVVIGYHSSASDPFYTGTAAARKSYYGVSGYPTVILDGSYRVVGGLHTGTMYPTYRQYFDSRSTVPSPLEIDLAVDYDSVSRNGNLSIVVRNPGSSACSGQLHTALIESHIYYPWQGMDSLQDVERTMLPDASGEGISVPAQDSVVRTRDFTIASNWVARNCEFVVFVQNNSNQEMHQGAMAAVVPEPALEFVGYQPALPVPGGECDLTVGLRNIGSAAVQSASAVLSTSDPHITVTTAVSNFGPIGIGADGYCQTPFRISVAAGCPDPHLAMMQLAVTTGDLSTDAAEFPLNITTNPGCYDNMEYGQHGWTHNGILDGWHLTTYRSVSPTHSWYCGLEGSYQYSNENDARLMTPLYTIGDSTAMHFQHSYATEAGYDFCLVELNNGSPFWRPLGSFSGSSSGWTRQEYDLSQFRGQTVQLRFRFISDYNVADEGWYVDDFWSGALTGVSEGLAGPALGFGVAQCPVRTAVELRYAVPTRTPARISIFDRAGRLVRQLECAASTGAATWDLTDNHGVGVEAGTYFARLASGGDDRILKVVVAR